MSDKKIYRYLLSTDGVNQLERSPAQLNPASVKLDGRSKQDILRFFLALSAQIRYFDLNNLPQGDWSPFLQKIAVGNDIVNETSLDSAFRVQKDCPPHLALILAFLKIYSYLQQDINTLSTRRLNFYYEEVLRVLRRAAIADQVHVVFELGKNAAPTLLKKGLLLDAGKTAEGTALLYGLDSEYVITQARIAMLMSDFADQDLSGRHIVYKTEDATQVLGVDAGWRPFGAPQLKVGEDMRHMVEASLGCAIASPNFFLAEGARTVTVVLHLKSNVAVSAIGFNLQSSLIIQMSGESGWVNPDKIVKASIAPDTNTNPLADPLDSTLTIIVEFGEAAPSLVAYNEDVHQRRLNTPWPVWTMTAKPLSFVLEILNRFTVSDVDVTVSVNGLVNLILQNDQAVQAVGTPTVPFGQMPSIGGNFFIGSSEAFSKSITSLSINLEWKDVPENMATHYAGYENGSINDGAFQHDVYFLAGKTWNKLTTSEELLFNPLGTQFPHKITFSPLAISQHLGYSNYKRYPDLSLGSSFTLDTPQGFIKLVLTGPTKQDIGNLPAYAPVEAFGHKSFSSIYAQHAIQIALGSTTVVLPQPPYTPTLSRIAIDYTATDTFKPATPNLVDQFFLFDVFGASESGEGSTVTLFPKQEHKGGLYLGLEKAAASQLLSFYFQMEEGSTPGTALLQSEEVTWSYLSGSRWIEIAKADILEDKTEGFQVPGLIRLLLGPDATTDHTLMPSGLHWLRASINANAEGMADVLNIYSQAARASLQEPASGFGDDFDVHLSSPLPSGTIKSLKTKIPAIKNINQATPSFGGRPSESNATYHQRVHERLCHRNRAVSLWDFERLILEVFPVIFKVKCLPHTDVDNKLTPGHIKLVVVPDWRKRPTGNPLQPKVNAAFLQTMEEFISKYHSVFSTVHVTNPVYETLLVDCKVSFNKGFDPGFYAAQLEEELKRFLSPWSYDEGEDIVFGGKIQSSEILAFVEGREYVEYVTNFALYHSYKGIPGGGISEMQIEIDFIVGLPVEPSISGPLVEGKTIGTDFVVGVPVDAAIATQPDAILVSSNTHRIGVITADELCEGVPSIGIGQMVVGLDFIPV